MTVANSLTQPFFQLEKPDDDEGPLNLRQTHKAEPKEALELTEAAVDVFRKNRHKALNLSYRQLVSQRVDCLVALERPKAAVKELDQLQRHLYKMGANAPVLDQINNLASTISSTPAHKVERYHRRRRLWDRVRTHDELAMVPGEPPQELKPASKRRKKASTQETKPPLRKSRKAAKKSRKR